MFPLGSVLLPTTVLPLRIFEPRYVQLLQDVMAGDMTFGVTLIERGFEVGGGDQRTNIGCVAQVLDVEPQDDGMWHLVAVGTNRFEVIEWLPDNPYPLAVVSDLEEPAATAEDTDVYNAAVAQLITVFELQSQLGQRQFPVPELADDPALGSFQLAAVAPLGSFDRQRLLAADRPGTRLALLIELLTDYQQDLQAQIGQQR